MYHFQWRLKYLKMNVKFYNIREFGNIHKEKKGQKMKIKFCKNLL